MVSVLENVETVPSEDVDSLVKYGTDEDVEKEEFTSCEVNSEENDGTVVMFEGPLPGEFDEII